MSEYVRALGSERLDDGRWHHRFSQSWLGDFEKCAEYARRDYADEFPWEETSDTARGTAVHAAIEACLQDIIDGAGEWHVEDMVGLAQRELDELLENPSFRFTKVKTPDTIRKQIESSVRAWHRAVLPKLDPMATEYKFKDLALVDTPERLITVTGTIDYLDWGMGAIDWKTASREYERWEKARWAIQPTTYTWALHQEIEAGRVSDDIGGRDLGVYDFTYFVMLASGEIQKLRVQRHLGDWAWLRNKATNAAVQIEAQVPEWPMNDGSWFCSEKWCPAFASCKGANYSEGLPWWQ